MTYYNGTLFPPSVQDFSLDISKLNPLQQRKRKAATKIKKTLKEEPTQPSLDFGQAVLPAQAGIQSKCKDDPIDSRLRGNDKEWRKNDIKRENDKNVSLIYRFFVLGTITVLVSFLIHQGYLFFSSIEDNDVSALSSAVVAELLPFAAAVMLGLSQSKIFKTVLFCMLLGCIGGLACFMYASLSLRMDERSDVSQKARIERVALEQSLIALGESIKTLPATHVSKRQVVISEMSKLQKDLSMSAAPVYATWRSSNASIQLAYSVWLRVAAMLMNAILVHYLVSHISLRSRT